VRANVKPVNKTPLNRLASVYESKLARYDDKYYYEFGYHIVKRNRDEALQKLGQNAVFPSGIDLDGQDVSLPHFWEFATHIIDNLEKPFNLDDAWRPVARMCRTCTYDYEYLLKYERLAEEIPALETRLFNEEDQFKRTEQERKTSIGQDKALIEKHFRHLDEYEIQQLYRVYRLDFEIFGYECHICKV